MVHNTVKKSGLLNPSLLLCLFPYLDFYHESTLDPHNVWEVRYGPIEPHVIDIVLFVYGCFLIAPLLSPSQFEEERGAPHPS